MSKLKVNIRLFPEDYGRMRYEIYSESKEDRAEPTVYSQGSGTQIAGDEFPSLDLKSSLAACNRDIVSPCQCYHSFRTMGLDYGPAFLCVNVMYKGPGYVLAKLNLPSSVADTLDNFTLHPSLMDSALHASIAFILNSGGASSTPNTLALPFALEQLEVIGKCSSTMWSLIRLTDGGEAGKEVRKLDAELCDEAGRICVRIIGIVIESLGRKDSNR